LQKNIAKKYCKKILQKNIAKKYCKKILQKNIAKKLKNISGVSISNSFS